LNPQNTTCINRQFGIAYDPIIKKFLIGASCQEGKLYPIENDFNIKKLNKIIKNSKIKCTKTFCTETRAMLNNISLKNIDNKILDQILKEYTIHQNNFCKNLSVNDK